MVCPDCGVETAEGASVCASCGKELQNAPRKDYGKDFAWASMVLGIVSMLIFPYLYGPLAILAAAVAKKQSCTGKMATAGLVLGIIAVVGYVVTQIVYRCLGFL